MKVKYSLFVIDKIKKYNYKRASNYRSIIMSTTIDEAIKHLDNMVKLLKEFKKEVKAQKFKPEWNFENSSTIFAEFNSELNELKKLKHHNLARVIVGDLGQVIEKNDLNMKLIITNKDTTQNIVELEMTSNLKKKEFYKKGIVIATDTSAINHELMKYVSEVTVNCHWSRKNRTSYNSTRELVDTVANELKHEKQYPRLKRVTILGCDTADIIPPEVETKSSSTMLYVYQCEKNNAATPDRKKIQSFPCFVLTISQGQYQLHYYIGQDKEETCGEMVKITKQKKLQNNYKVLAVCNKNDIPLIPDSILKNIYDKTNSAKINGVNNPYLHRGATVGDVQSREEWRNRKKNIPTLSCGLFKFDNKKIHNSNLAERAALIINNSRNNVKVKGYLIPITPDENHGFMKPMTIHEDTPCKAVIIDHGQ
ncbi:TPA: lpg2372 family Dot/Icm T4SS effector [Legionella pneumophila]|uniref:Lpg2372 family Dot/Icm T4SS effector n=2 Tax=Legionella pneumophila TaxID=446 RepID=A0AAN5PHY3_LEGPN|nr:lpg2372 family Dot/Icm T4SS effector [Legionella pneumophila]ERH42831.1 hypothetical protein N750_02515 [Legionella pneumophila str. Leg01/53]ERH43856.1 hypothetical protein N751_15105 [Legionella pneumophila str. Leg01/11]ERI47275.1 hypothetical protein N749_14980 [Legionella pneumophila str. Leg01/20]ANN96967.1 hypothetical protein A9P84_15165 [Legionella pneumophila]ERB41330.1 hypothetical protein N748_09550 [Legionella pneumophila str. 121004]